MLPAISLVQMDDHADTEDCDEERIGGQTGSVLENALLDSARVEGAFSPVVLLRLLGSHCSKLLVSWFWKRPDSEGVGIVVVSE